MTVIRVGMQNLIDSTMEILSRAFSEHKDEETVKKLQSFVNDMQKTKSTLPRYTGKEAKGHIMASEKCDQFENAIKEVLVEMFLIDLMDKKKYMSQDKIEEYKGDVNCFLNNIIKCKSYVIHSGIAVSAIKGNSSLKRKICRCDKVTDIIERNKVLDMNEFHEVCTYIDLDPSLLKKVLELCSVELMIQILDLKFVQFLVEKTFFPNQNNEILQKIGDSYVRLINHIILYKYSQSIEKYNTDKQARRSPYFSSYTSNVKGNSATHLWITLLTTQFLLSVCGLLFVLVHIHDVVNLVTSKDMLIAICSVNIILDITAIVLIFIGNRFSRDDKACVTKDIVLDSFYIPNENLVEL